MMVPLRPVHPDHILPVSAPLLPRPPQMPSSPSSASPPSGHPAFALPSPGRPSAAIGTTVAPYGGAACRPTTSPTRRTGHEACCCLPRRRKAHPSAEIYGSGVCRMLVALRHVLPSPQLPAFNKNEGMRLRVHDPIRPLCGPCRGGCASPQTPPALRSFHGDFAVGRVRTRSWTLTRVPGACRGKSS